MNVASLELSKELYELSGWDDTWDWYCDNSWNPMLVNPTGYEIRTPDENDLFKIAPAYDLGLLVRLMPFVELTRWSDGDYTAVWRGNEMKVKQTSRSSPENALCRLAIKLFENGVLTKSGE